MIAMKTKFLLLFAILSIFATSMVLHPVRAENNAPVASNKKGWKLGTWKDPSGMIHWEVYMTGVYGIKGTAWFTGWSQAYPEYPNNDWRGQYYEKMSVSKTWLFLGSNRCITVDTLFGP